MYILTNVFIYNLISLFVFLRLVKAFNFVMISALVISTSKWKRVYRLIADNNAIMVPLPVTTVFYG